jgi:hypothetical protein
MMQPTDSWFLSVKAWMKQPPNVPKTFVVEVSEPDELPLAKDDSDDPSTPPSPKPPMSKRTVLHTILIHVSEVVDHGTVITGLPPKYQHNYGDKTHTISLSSAAVSMATSLLR